MTTTLLFVCHANLCRSPMAERLARLALTDGHREIVVASAGTHARPGLAMHPGAVAALLEARADPDGFRSRTLTPELLAGADLILTATRAQRAICVELAPRALRRVYTIRQFGRLAAALVADREPGREADKESDRETTKENGTGDGIATVLAGIARMRAGRQPRPADDDDLADPVLGTTEDFRACATQIGRSLRPALAVIAGT